MDFLRVPLGYLLGWIYEFVTNYGLALILFTLVIKIILLPLTLKQQKSMTRMQKIQPELTKLQEKYKNDQQLLSQETMKLYKKYGVSPMGGCLPLLIQLPILFSLYQVIYKPLTYMLHYSASQIKAVEALAIASGNNASGNMKEIILAKVDGVNFDFLGLDLASSPNMKLWWTLLIPVLAAVTTYLSSKISIWMNKKPESEKAEEKKPQRILSPDQKPAPGSANNTAGVAKSMSMIMPVITLFITYGLPMAMGLYWIASNVFSMAQTFVLNGYYSKKFSDEIETNNMIRAEKQSALHGDKKKRRK